MDGNASIDSQVDGEEDVLEPEVVDDGRSPFGNFNFRFLMSDTGEGAVEDYLSHPLNFNGSKSIARVLRGLTGIVGNLKLAIIDIVLGGLEYAKDKRAGSDTPVNPL